MYSEHHPSLDITDYATVLSYTPTAAMAAIVRVDATGIAGTGTYSLNTYINGSLIAPDSSIPVGTTSAIMQSKAIALDEGDELVVKLKGDASDNDVAVVARLIDITPPSESKITTIVQQAVAQVTLDVRPERIVLGPCQKKSVKTISSKDS